MTDLPTTVTSEIVDLPSGARLALRKLAVGDENRLAKAGGARASAQAVLNEVLAACCTSVIDPGPYPFLRDNGRVDWRKMLLGDRIATMIHLRVISYPERERFTVYAVKCPRCGKTTDYEIDLLRDLSWRPLEAETRARFEAGQPFAVTVDGRRVEFTLSTGTTEELHERLAALHPDRDMTCLLRSRIVGVEGVDVAEIMNWIDGTGGKWPGLTSADAEELRDAFDLVECGIDTDVELACPAMGCGGVFTINLPFDGLLMPSRGIQARRRARRRGAPC